jgi:hypothetical protein
MNASTVPTTRAILAARSNVGVSISNHEWCTLSETEDFTDVLGWLHTGIEEIGFEVERIYPRARSLLMSVSS